MLKEFKEFAMRGNVIDMAVGIIIGAAFGKIVTSLVNDVIMPPIGLLMGNVDFSNLFVNSSGGDYATRRGSQAAGAPILKYGIFINTVLDFVIVAFVIFLVIRALNTLKSKQEAAPPPPARADGREKLLTEIRDTLRRRAAEPSGAQPASAIRAR